MKSVAKRLKPQLIVLEALHPLGPVGGLDAAGEGPAAGGVEIAMPLEGPQLL